MSARCRFLKENKFKLHELAHYLYKKETITGDEFMNLLTRENPLMPSSNLSFLKPLTGSSSVSPCLLCAARGIWEGSFCYRRARTVGIMGAELSSVAAAFAVRHRTHITHPFRKGALLNREPDLRFAILIDADNVSEKYVQIVLDEVANAGVATYKRIYGDWTSPRLSSWKKCLLDNSIIPMQQYSYTFGKNATDSAMIIDAMDILYSGTVDGFAIVNSSASILRAWSPACAKAACTS